jgi:predicted Zn-dependent protease
MSAMKTILFATLIILLSFGRAAKAIDLWGALRAVTGFTAEEELAIGRQAAGNLLGAAPLVNDLRLQQYVIKSGAGLQAGVSVPT